MRFPSFLFQSTVQRVARGSFWILLGTGLGRVMNLVAMVFAARILGAEGYGGFALVQSTIGLLGLFAGAALGVTATRFIAATLRTDRARTGRIVALISGSSLFLALLFAGLTAILAPWLARVVLLAPELSSATALGAILLAAAVLRGVQDATLAGFEAFRHIAFLRFLEGAATLVLVPILVRQFGPAGGITALGVGMAVALAAGAVFSTQQLRRHNIVPRWREAVTEWRILRDFSAPSLVSNTVATPILWFSILLLSQTPGGLAEVGIYNAAYQWHGPLVFVPMAITTVSLPILSQIWDEGDAVEFRRLFVKLFAFGALLSLIPAILAVVLSPQIIGIYGEEFRSRSLVLPLILLAAPFHVTSNIATSAIQSMNRSWYLLVFNVLWGATLLIIVVLTIGTRGAEGLAIAFLASYFILAISKSLFVLWRTVRIDSTLDKKPVQQNT